MSIRRHRLLACCLAAVLAGLSGGCKSEPATTKPASEGKTGTLEVNPSAGGAKGQPGGVQPNKKESISGGGKVE